MLRYTKLLKTIRIPENVTSIGRYAFADCTGLTEIGFYPTEVMDEAYNYGGIFYSAGTDCDGVTVTIGSNVKRIPKYTFSGYSATYNIPKIKSVIFKDGSVCEEIGYGAFSYCPWLDRISIPGNVKSIGSNAFYGCTNLTSVTISASVTEMGYDVFGECPKLINAGVSGSGCNIEFGWVDVIPKNAFEGCSSLMTIALPDSVVEIGNMAFYDAMSLNAINIPQNVTSIGEECFVGCENLKTVGPLGSNCNVEFGWTEAILPEAFANCSGIEEITIPESITTLGESAFRNCTNLAKINYNATVMPDSANSYTFYAAGSNDIGITLTIGENVTRIPANLFNNLGNLKILEFNPNSTCTEIAQSAFSGCRNLTVVTIPESIQHIGRSAFFQSLNLEQINYNAIAAVDADEAFYYAGSDTSKLIVGKQVTLIPDGVCERSNISEVVFEDNSNCKKIGSSAFVACENLVKIRIPESVTEVGNGAFGASGGIYYDKSGLISAGPVGGGYSIEFPWTDEILANAFSGCSSLREVHIPETITKIGANAFSGCSELTSITIPQNVVSLGKEAFKDCRKLESIIFYPTLMNDLTIDSYAFHCADGFISESVKLVIGSNVTRIPAFLFGTADHKLGVNPYKSHGVEIKEVHFEKNSVCKSIGANAFYRCDQISDVYYGGTEEEWDGINSGGGNAPLYNAEIHFNSFDSGADDGSGEDDENESSSNGYVRFFIEWDAEKQIAYLDSDLSEWFGSQVTEETDTSFLANVQDLIGTYVLAETKIRTDGMLLPDTLISIRPLVTKTGIINSVGECIVIDGKEYQFDLIGMNFFEENDYVMYHLYNDIIISITVLRPYQKPDSGGSDNWTDYPEFDYDAPPYDPSNEEKLLKLYADEWQKKYDEYIAAVKEQLDKAAGSEESIKAAAIKAEADRMRIADSRSGYSKFITFTDKSCPYKTEAYTALATLLYEEGADQFDFGKEEVDAGLINSIMKSLYGSKKTIVYGNVEVYINILQAGNSKFGNLKCTNTRTKKTYDAVICSTQDEISKTVSSFCDELDQLADNAKFNVFQAVTEDILDVELSSLEPENIADKLKELEDEFLVDPLDLLKDIGVGQLFDTIEKCYHYFRDVEQNAWYGNKEALEKLTDEDTLIDFDEAEASWKVKRKLNALQKATDELNDLIDEFITGKLDVSDWELYWKSTFKCPISIAVYSSDGTQIGYVSEDECWYDSSIRIARNGSEKVVYSFTEDPLSFKVTANDYGAMNCSFEEYGENSTPIGRLNFYDIALAPDQEFTTTLENDLFANSKLMSVRTDNKAILADEYVSSDDFASVDVSCIARTDDGSIGGLVLGEGTFVKGDTVTLRAISEVGYEFAGWYAEDTLLSEECIYEFTARENLTLTANFTFNKDVYLDIFVEGSGTVSGTGEYSPGEVVAIEAYPEESYVFIGWYIDSELVSTEAIFELSVDESVLLLAVFAPCEHMTEIQGEQWCTDENNHWHTCIDCDGKFDVSAHSGGTATCTQKANCAVCGIPYGELAPHDYANGICLECGAKIVGDITGDKTVNEEDVVYLIWHTLFPDMYPLDQDAADFNADTEITDADALVLLWHILFPEQYPLR